MGAVATIAAGLFLLLYIAFTALTVYFVVVGRKTNNATEIGKLIWYHGITWIVLMITVVGGSMVLVAANILATVLNVQFLVGR